MKIEQVQPKIYANVSVQKNENVKKVPFKSSKNIDTFNNQKKELSAEELREKQLFLKLRINEQLEVETDKKKIKKLNEYNKVLDVLLANSYNNEGVNSKNLNIISFKGMKEVAAAKKIVHKHALIAAGIGAAMSQIPLGDEAALAANDVAMAGAICKVYNKSPKTQVLSGVVASLIGNILGVKVFTKCISWFPGAGNLVNASVAASITEYVGKGIIQLLEDGKKF